MHKYHQTLVIYCTIFSNKTAVRAGALGLSWLLARCSKAYDFSDARAFAAQIKGVEINIGWNKLAGVNGADDIFVPLRDKVICVFGDDETRNESVMYHACEIT